LYPSLLKGRYTLDIFARDIAIKRYCDQKIFLSHGYQQAKVSSYQNIIQGFKRAYLGFQ